MPTAPRPYTSTTSDTTAAKRERVWKALADHRNHGKSNREIAAEVAVTETMVRSWRTKLGLPKLAPGTGLPVTPAKKKRGK